MADYILIMVLEWYGHHGDDGEIYSVTGFKNKAACEYVIADMESKTKKIYFAKCYPDR